MNSKKKAIELIFNLQWRSQPDNGSDKSNIIGMYDTPVTTSDFEMFKSYLLKNSGVAANDVKVTYITDCGQEWVVDSQEWFEVALGSFRLKARLGEVIFLKLDKVITRKHSNVNQETQSDDSGPSSLDVPPEWFINYMNQFKREIITEMSLNFLNAEASASVPHIAPATPKKEKLKEAPTRKHRRMTLTEAAAEVYDKKTSKALANERKLDMKLDRLEAKSKKLKEKKSMAQAGKHLPKTCTDQNDMYKLADRLWDKYQVKGTVVDASPMLDATIVSLGDDNPMVMMSGGEVYLHTWNVMNNGQVTWSPETELRMAWGSEELKPSVKSVRCPRLKPGEKGTISVCFQIPKTYGKYETHWNFYLGYIRFGRTLNCTVFVTMTLSATREPSFGRSKSEMKHCGTDPMVSYSVSEPAMKQSLVDGRIYGSKKRAAHLKFEKPGIWTTNMQSEPEVPKSFPRELVPKNHIKRDEVEDGAMDLSKKMEIQKVKTSPVRFVEQEKRTTSPEKASVSYGISENELLVNLSQGFEDTKPVSPVKVKDLFTDRACDMKVKEESAYTKIMQEIVDPKAPQEFADRKANEELAYLQMITDMKAIQDLAEMKAIQDLAEMKAIQDLADMKAIQDLADMKAIQDLADMKAIQDLAEMKAIEDLVEMKVKEDLADLKVKAEPANEDNNNNETMANNNSSGESISEVASIASDISSGYDVLNVPECEDKDELSGYVYITIDGNKLPVPKHILRPDVVATAEEAPGPLQFEDEAKVDEPLRPALDIQSATNIEDMLAHCCLQDTHEDGARLFIFPQSTPGFEVVNMEAETGEKPSGEEATAAHDYCWANSQTRYTLEDVGKQCINAQESDVSGHRNPYRRVPNYQQSSPRAQSEQSETLTPPKAQTPKITPTAPTQLSQSAAQSVPVHILPENLVSGAVNVASSAINTARSVINMIVTKPEAGRWVNGHWVTDNQESIRAKNLRILQEMGFLNEDLNATLLARYNDDLARVISELVS